MSQSDLRSTPSARPALEGVRVIELGTFISAPFAATLLADFGADVIKIELPEQGDPMRTLGIYPPGGDSSYWWSQMGRNKRSVALDIRTPEGREIIGRLIETADILIENFRPGTLDRWGLTLEWLKERRPDIIVVRISGYGQDGPWRDVPGFDRNAQAFSGLVYVTGEKAMPPQQAGLPVCDYTAGLWAAFGAAMAMLGRLRHGETVGNEVDLALYETMIPFLKDMPLRYQHEGQVTERTGNTPDYVSPGGAYMTGSNEWIFISGTGDRVFARLMAAIGAPDLVEHPMFRQNKDRVTNRAALDARIDAWLSQRSTAEVLAAFESADVPAMKIQSIADLMAHPQVVARGNFVRMPDDDGKELCLTAPVPRLARMGATVRFPGQKLGAATREILEQELNMSEQSLATLRERKIIGG